MKQLAMCLLALGVVGCGTSVKTVTSRPNLGPARGEGAKPAPVVHGFHPRVGVEHATFRAATGCGVERWAVKTGTDPAASMVNTKPQDSYIADLDSIQPPLDPTDRVAPTETATFRITATITAIKQESDSDYHLALSDGQGHTMIAESPSPSCDQGSVFASQIQQVRSTIDQACPAVSGIAHLSFITLGIFSLRPTYKNVSIPAELTGPGFFDRLHGQRGVAPNGIELHPLLAITLHGHC